jgi:hypothetical protein
MRIGAGLASTKFTLFSWLSSASRTTNRQGLFPFGCHRSMMQRRSSTRCSILISSFILAPPFLPVCLRTVRCEFFVSVIDQTQELRNEKVIAELFASETKCAVRFVRKSCLSIHATRSSRASPGKPRMTRQKEAQCVSSLPFVRCCSRS